MLTIDGTTGEGGGQVLRSSLTLSMATGQPFRVTNIRKKRAKPGLLRQHLTSVLAARDVAGAEVTGAILGSTELTFRPKRVRAGSYAFAVGTAGSCLLVLATILVPLALAEGPSVLTLEGGTHNPAAPPYPFVEGSLFPALARVGIEARGHLERAGFYPAGGGKLQVELAGGAKLTRLSLLRAGKLLTRSARGIVANLPPGVGAREIETFVAAAGWPKDADARPEILRDPLGPGNVLVATLAYEHVAAVLSEFGEKGVPAERVGGKLASEVTRFTAADVPVCQHLADQLLLPMALGAGGEFRTVRPTPHFDAQCTLIRLFLGQEVQVIDEGGGAFRVEVPGRA